MSQYKQLLQAVKITSKKNPDYLREVKLETKDDNVKWLSVDESTESKSDTPIGTTVMDYTNEHYDWTKTSVDDLRKAFEDIRSIDRSRHSLHTRLEERAVKFHGKIMALKKINPLTYIDPDEKPCSTQPCTEGDVKEVRKLVFSPSYWNMESSKSAKELKELLHSLTAYSPLKGRPFIRTWIHALTPCFCRWIQLSDRGDKSVTETLKHFLAAFGQSGIVVCIEDRGKSLLKTLQASARSVEANGRGAVERYYWKRQVESAFLKDSGWRELSSDESTSLTVSQLDLVPENWLLDSEDWVNVFSEVISPEISKRFEQKLHEIFDPKDLNVSIHPGPPKTLSRSTAKCKEYKLEYHKDENHPRWFNFKNNFKKAFRRSPTKHTDFVWNLIDWARCSINVDNASDLLKVKEVLEKCFNVAQIKNDYSSKSLAKGSGYRDYKLIVEVEFENLKLEGVPNVGLDKTKMLCEIQLICKKWLDNKKTTSLSYKVIRALSFRDLLLDFGKYLKKEESLKRDHIQILKKGWVNMAKCIDFSNINKDQLLVEAARQGWQPAGVEILIKNGGNVASVGKKGSSLVLLAANYGHDTLLKTLIELKGDIHRKNRFGDTAMHWACHYGYERCVRLLLERKALPDVENVWGQTALDNAKKLDGNNSIYKLLLGEDLPRLKLKKTPSLEDQAKAAAGTADLLSWFDLNDIGVSKVSDLVASRNVATLVKNIIQVHYYGGNFERKNWNGKSPILFACAGKNPRSVETLLRLKADINVRDNNEWTPIMTAAKRGTAIMVKLLVDAGADVNEPNKWKWSPLMIAITYNTEVMVKALIDMDANVNAVSDINETPLVTAIRYGTKKMIKDLIEARADPEAKVGDDKTPMMVAAQLGNKKIIAALLEAEKSFKATMNNRLKTQYIVLKVGSKVAL